MNVYRSDNRKNIKIWRNKYLFLQRAIKAELDVLANVHEIKEMLKTLGRCRLGATGVSGWSP